MKKSYYIGMVAILFGMTTGCTSTVTLGPKANDTAVLGAKAGTDGASVTLPLIKGEVGPAEKKK
ncbi:hypothetical protein CL634_07915 [bacterium]|nr:hypothetical protein [bacterium]|tara:strand:- start:536 stop:727 length:192 start_codon:yes stop_codon:yes gene_type:complete